ncbi:MAG: rRNA maturation RNase YbeY [Chlamydiae bacterium]|nr:rRNA maturation RNase YbeY [Chlamydiota bacterium]
MAAQVLKKFNVQSNFVNIYFVTEKKIKTLHKKYFNDPSATDCISFPMDYPKGDCLGEVFVCPTIAKKYVEKKKGNLEREIVLYTVHGLLHLIGFDDKTVETRKSIKKMERYFLRNIR